MPSFGIAQFVVDKVRVLILQNPQTYCRMTDFKPQLAKNFRQCSQRNPNNRSIHFHSKAYYIAEEMFVWQIACPNKPETASSALVKLLPLTVPAIPVKAFRTAAFTPRHERALSKAKAI